MKITYKEPENQNEIINRPKAIKIDFSLIKKISIDKNITHCLITGKLGANHKINGNIIGSELVNLICNKIDWRRNDIKDCLIKNCIFNNANFNITALMNNIVADTSYQKTSFIDATFTDTIFENVVFKNCDLTSLVIKRCEFINCEFYLCQTSNKLIEHCILHKTTFNKTDIRLETILENFGVLSSFFHNGLIHIDEESYDEENYENALNILLANNELSTSLERFNLITFIESDFGKIYNEFEEALDIKSWLPLCRIPATLNNLLTGFASYLIYLYESEQIPLSPLLKLYYITTKLDKRPTDNPYLTESQSVWTSVSMKLLPYFENHLALVDSITASYFPYLFLLVEGPENPEYYASLFSNTLNLKMFSIEKITRRNSPSELLVLFKEPLYFAALISIFLSTRFKAEIKYLRMKTVEENDPKKITAGQKKIKRKVNNNLPVSNDDPNFRTKPRQFAFEIGPSPESNSAYKLRLFALFPEKVAVDLQIDLHLRIIYKLRSILLEVLRPHK